MSQSEYYIRMAEEADRTAASLPDIVIKRQFQEIARQWREMAKRVENFEQTPRGSKVVGARPAADYLSSANEQHPVGQQQQQIQSKEPEGDNK